MDDTFTQRTDTIQLRIDSLKTNRVFITAFFTIITAISTIVFSTFTNILNTSNIPNSLRITIIWLLITLICMLYSMFTITDSIHFYTKYLEYSFCWIDAVHGEAYGIENKECKQISDYQRALEADDVGYYYMKLSTLFFTFAIGSLIVRLISDFIAGFCKNQHIFPTISVITYILLLCSIVQTCGWVHGKDFFDAFKDYVKRKKVFDKIRECEKPNI